MQKKLTDSVIDKIGLAAIWVYFVCYVIFASGFAELNIQIPFLKFPIFVGELLLAFCLILFLKKHNKHIFQKKFWNIFIIAYCMFFLIKAAFGFQEWGSLALRHSALFYYPLFICISYSFFKVKYFDDFTKYLLLGSILLILFNRHFYEYWIFTCIILAILLINSLKSIKLRVGFFISLILFTPFKFLFDTSRMMFMSYAAGVAIVLTSLFIFFPFKKRFKVSIFLLSVFIIFVGMKKEKLLDRFNTSFQMTQMIEIFKDYDAIVQNVRVDENQDVENVREEKKIEIYHKRKDFEEHHRVRLAENVDDMAEDVAERVENLSQEGEEVQFDNVEVKGQLRDLFDYIFDGRDDFETFSFSDFIQELKEQYIEFAETGKKSYELTKTKEYYNQFYSHSVECNLVEVKFLDQLLKLRIYEYLSGLSFRIRITPAVDQVIIESLHNSVFRFFIWRDMFVEIREALPLLGFDFGKPLRSKSLETLLWGSIEWSRDGWVAAHNSYFNYIYRAGVIGCIFIIAIFWKLLESSIFFFKRKSFKGILMIANLVSWFLAANFLVIFEVPYTAIPIWVMFGLMLGYCDHLKLKESGGAVS